MDENSRLVDANFLKDWSTRLFVAAGMRPDEAAIGADVLVRTSLRGIDTHGISRVPQYASALLAGAINPKPAHRGHFREGVLYYAGDRGLGQLIGACAVRTALEIAREMPVVPCLLRQCGHVAALGVYVLMIAEGGMFGFMCQSTRPSMGGPGWKGRAIGNNPLAFATPIQGRPPVVFDMASSVVAGGNLGQAVREKTSIPEGWAVGPDGQPTTDPEVGIAGAMLPLGGYKGLGLAMLVQCLAGSFNGNSAMLDQTGPASEMGAFLLVINPELIADDYLDDVSIWLDRYLAAAGTNGRYPGQRAAESEMRRRTEGIPVLSGSLAQFAAIGMRLDVPFEPTS